MEKMLRGGQMSSYYILTLDTTPPDVTIDAPATVIPGMRSGIYINGSEPIAEYQEIYIVDSNGTRHDLTFLYQPENNRFYGALNFLGYPFGLATIYARLKDNVHNLSSLASAVIDIRNVSPLIYSLIVAPLPSLLDVTAMKSLVDVLRMPGLLDMSESNRLLMVQGIPDWFKSQAKE